MDEIWINYCGMPVCFGLQEFAKVTGLRCHRPEGPPPHKRSKARKYKGKIDGLFDIARRGYKASELLIDLKDKSIPDKYREQLCLVWFAHSIILARDVNKVLEDDLLARAEDFDNFNNYPWGYDSFYLTVQYLLTKLSSGTTTLYGFFWAFMSNTNIKEADLFNPPDDAVHLLQVLHPWIVPTEEEPVMTSYITLGHIDTIADPTVELIKKEWAGATTIRRAVRQGQPNVEALHDQPFTKADPATSSGRVVGVGGRHADASTTPDDNTPFRPYIGSSHPSSPSCSRCEYDECKDRWDKLFEKVEAISKAIKEFKSKRCVIQFKKVREPHTPITLVRRKKRAIRDILSAQKSKEITIPPSPKAFEVQGPVKKVEIYVELGAEEKRDLWQAKNANPGAPDYPRPPFPPQDFQTMTDMRMPYEDKATGKIQLTYRESYDVADRIMDLNICKKLKDRSDQLNREASALGVGLDFLVPTLVFDEEEMLRYVRGNRPNPHGKSWTEVKRILAVIIMNGMHYQAVEILLEKGKINVYESNVPLIDDFDLFLLVEPLMVLLPILLRESKLMNHLPKEVLMKKSWDFQGQNRGMILPKDDAAKASGSHALTHNECLLIDTEMTEPTTFLCDNAVANLQEVWSYGVLTGRLKPVYIEEPVK
ncbi:hypothetical protein P3S67_005815 [Capsicum chacoense]